jgi:hypothetical protein
VEASRYAEGTFTSPGQIYSLRSAYLNAASHGVTVLAASGDQGSTDDICDPASGCADPDNVICCSSSPSVDWPSTDPLVTGVGGTQLHLNAQGQRTAPDSVWDDLSSTVGVPGPVYTWGSSGGGRSAVFSRPQFQDGVTRAVGGSRGTPDISMSAAVNGAVGFYDTTDPGVAGWGIVGGTSEASPLFSGIVALADQVAGQRLHVLPGGRHQQRRLLRRKLRPGDRPRRQRQRHLQQRDRLGHGERCRVRSRPGASRGQLLTSPAGRDRLARQAAGGAAECRPSFRCRAPAAAASATDHHS